MAINIEIKFEFPDFSEVVKRRLPEIKLFTAAQIQANRGFMFDAEGADNGKEKWAPLKWREGQILSDRGNLRKSWSPNNPQGYPGQDGIVEISGESISVGTKLLYASLMNWGTTQMPGGVLVPKSASALKIPAPKGKEGYLFRKSVKIPSRRMDVWSDQDNEELTEAVTNKVIEVMNDAA